MKKMNANNERIKRDYYTYSTEAKRKSPSTLNGIRKSLLRYESFTGFKDFSTFNQHQAIAFKKYLSEEKNLHNGDALSKATILSTLNDIKAFFRWLAFRPGFRSKINVPDIEYLNLSEKETRMAKSPRYKEVPTVEQIQHVVSSMPINGDIALRNRALIAFTLLTGIRDGAIASLKIKHVDIHRRLVKQDPLEVKTKFSKRIDTFFFPVGEKIEKIVVDWVEYLKREKLYGLDAPLFPRTKLSHNSGKSFHANGIEPIHWTTASPIREIFKKAFAHAGLPYYNPHSFRNTLVSLGERLCRTPEEFKAWSQNLGHEQVLTTFNSYGYVTPDRQGNVIRGLGGNKTDSASILEEIKRLMKE